MKDVFFLHSWVDGTYSDAILAVVNSDSESLLRELAAPYRLASRNWRKR